MAATVVDYSVVARPNRSLTPAGRAGVVAALSLPLTVISCAFALAGAWLVLPFAGLELFLLAYAFHYIHRHAGDYESITIDSDHLAVEKQHLDRTCHIVFHPYWTQVVLRPAPGGNHRLWLRSHGCEVEVGSHMNDDQRLTLAQQLRMRTGPVY